HVTGVQTCALPIFPEKGFGGLRIPSVSLKHSQIVQRNGDVWMLVSMNLPAQPKRLAQIHLGPVEVALLPQDRAEVGQRREHVRMLFSQRLPPDVDRLPHGRDGGVQVTPPVVQYARLVAGQADIRMLVTE